MPLAIVGTTKTAAASRLRRVPAASVAFFVVFFVQRGMRSKTTPIRKRAIGKWTSDGWISQGSMVVLLFGPREPTLAENLAARRLAGTEAARAADENTRVRSRNVRDAYLLDLQGACRTHAGQSLPESRRRLKDQRELLRRHEKLITNPKRKRGHPSLTLRVGLTISMPG